MGPEWPGRKKRKYVLQQQMNQSRYFKTKIKKDVNQKYI